MLSEFNISVKGYFNIFHFKFKALEHGVRLELTNTYFADRTVNQFRQPRFGRGSRIRTHVKEFRRLLPIL